MFVGKLFSKAHKNVTMKSWLVVLTTVIPCFCFFNASYAQDKDSTASKKEFKNTIRFNLSAPLIFGKRYLVFGYERLVNANQSFSVNFGSYGLPVFVSPSDSLKVSGTRKDRGVNVSVDYRFYLTTENKYAAPRGVYIGPYYSFNYLSRVNDWTFNSEAFNVDNGSTFKFGVHTIGAELGYQFIFWNRFAVDFVAVGPGIAHYNLNTVLNTNVEPGKRTAILAAIAQRIKETVPGSGTFLNEAQFKKDGTLSTWDIGLRYILHIGYRF
jgi:hypothetical protein